jgi:transposase
MQITTIGLDLAKHWFPVHGVDANGHIVVRRRLWRSAVIAYFRSLEPCLVGMEACATAHHHRTAGSQACREPDEDNCS